MPVRRAKSCYSCRIAKVRCSLSSPCSRCAKRHLECSYAPAHPRRSEKRSTEGFRPLQPAVESPTVTRPFDAVRGFGAARARDSYATAENTSAGASQSPSIVSTIATDSETVMLTVAGSQLPDLTGCSECAPYSFNWPGALQLPDLSPFSDFEQQHFDSPVTFDLPSSFNSMEPLDCPPIASATASLRATMEPWTAIVASSTKALGPQLSQRARSLQQGSLTAKMILSRLTDYTRKMADGKQLPPFIFPPCFLSRDEQCPSDSPHQCLQEKLAICVNLTQMFYSRLPGSHSFVWQQICTHIRQMRMEVIPI